MYYYGKLRCGEVKWQANMLVSRYEVGNKTKNVLPLLVLSGRNKKGKINYQAGCGDAYL